MRPHSRAPTGEGTVAFRVTVAPADTDIATAALWELGTSGIEVQESPSDVTLLAYFPTAECEPIERALRGIPRARVEPADVPDVDWVARFREGFGAFDVGPFRIVPAWAAGVRASTDLIVAPGRAFGTGTHESTRLCLEAVAALPAPAPRRVLDVGTGTGILAVAAHCRGAATVVAADIDPEAVDAARLHARLNETPIHVVRADGARPFKAASFDLVIANLTAPLLRERAAELVSAAARGGAIVLAGLLAEDAESLRESHPAFSTAEVRRLGEWAALVVRCP